MTVQNTSRSESKHVVGKGSWKDREVGKFIPQFCIVRISYLLCGVTRA